jgi:hypothetical protein
MKETIYLVCDATGVRKMYKIPPKVKPGQVAVKVIVGIDDRVLMPPPMAEVKLNVELPIPEINRRNTAIVQD